MVARQRVIPIILGGDQTIALPDVTGVAHHFWFRDEYAVIHFDAHAKPATRQLGSLLWTGHAHAPTDRSGRLPRDRSLQIGLRGYKPEPETLDWMAAQRMRSLR